MTAKYYQPQPQAYEPSQDDRSWAAEISSRGSFLPWRMVKTPRPKGLPQRQRDAVNRCRRNREK